MTFSQVFWPVVLFALAGFFHSFAVIFSDNIVFRSSIFRKLPAKYFLKSESWQNAYKRPRGGELRVKYFNRLNHPIYFEKFLGSSTVFGFLFSAYALVSLFRNMAVAAAICRAWELSFWVNVALSFGLALLFEFTAALYLYAFSVTKPR